MYELGADLELERAKLQLQRRSFDAMVPPSSIRLELCEESHRHWVIRAVPTMRLVAKYENQSVARFVLEQLSAKLAERRRDLTRPYGTCGFCSGALAERTDTGLKSSTYRWCPQCGKFTLPVGARK